MTIDYQAKRKCPDCMGWILDLDMPWCSACTKLRKDDARRWEEEQMEGYDFTGDSAQAFDMFAE